MCIIIRCVTKVSHVENVVGRAENVLANHYNIIGGTKYTQCQKELHQYNVLKTSAC